MRILVCGGAGYIGSHMVRRLLRDGHDVVVFDNLSTGHREALGNAPLIEGDLLELASVDVVFDRYPVEAVIHFGALSLVADSVRSPYTYHENNVTGSLNLLRAMRRHGVDRIVFSSTAAVFGDPVYIPIDENHPLRPISPYGVSKLMIECMLIEAARAYGLRSVALRYFNAAGADPSGEIGESHEPETHLIPNVLAAALGRGEPLKVFGMDYATRDGTCIRDYVHVNDLVDAHLAALSFMARKKGAHCFNLGSERGFTVLEIIEAARRVSRVDIPYEIGPRRAGDPPALVASSTKAGDHLGWEPQFICIEDILDTAWRWHRKRRY